MKAIRINDYGAPLHIDEVPVPSPGPGQVLVENHYTSMNGVDPGRGEGFLRESFRCSSLGHPVAMSPVALLPSARASRTSTSAMKCLVTREKQAPTPNLCWSTPPVSRTGPSSIPAEVGAAIALVGQTATQMLELSEVHAGQTVLILGASGGVGSLAVQFARNAGVHVIVTARPSKADALQQLGAERVIDLSKQRLEDIPQVDAVLNLIGGDTVARSYQLVKKGGVAVTSNRPPIAEEAERLGIGAAFVETNVTTEGLNAFATLVTEGKIKPQIAAVTTLWSPETLWEKHETEKIGKIVFSVRS